MDDNLSLPSSLPPANVDPESQDSDAEDDPEEGTLDWSKLLARPVIPKRGEKQFEPGQGSNAGREKETGLQQHVLGRAREAMWTTLRASRTISNKSISYAVYYPSLRRAHVTLARGVHFSTIGHSAPRKVLVKDEEKVQKRLELLPEEAIYLIERGSILCFLAPPRSTSLAVESDFLDLNLAESNLTPMSVQQTYSLLLSPSDPDGLTQDHYVVYAYLKRLGYTVTRTAPPKESEDWWISPPPFSPSLLTRSGTQETGILARVYRFFSHPLAWFWKGSQRSQSRTPTALRDWWHPISFLSWLKSRNTYASLFRSLRFIPAGYTLPVHCSTPSSSMSSPYTPFFNVYKPPTPYKKSAPAPPDYQISVVNARTAPMPTLFELEALFGISPEVPPPPPKRRGPFTKENTKPTPQPPSIPRLLKMFPCLQWLLPNPGPKPIVRKPNPFAVLKAGRKMVVVAVVENGNVGFWRFGEGVFGEWPMA